jgi:2,4-dienoyl-CoA reductase (NADPH2)
MPHIPGIEDEKVVMAEDVLTGKAPLGRKVVVIGAGGAACEAGSYMARRGALSPEAAVFLAENGVLSAERALDMAGKGQRQVTLVRRGAKIGGSLGRSTRWVILQELRNLSVNAITEAEYKEINQTGLLISVEGRDQLIEADTIVIAAGYEVDPGLADKWKDAAPEVHIIGDARSPRKGIDAIQEGSLLGRLI